MKITSLSDLPEVPTSHAGVGKKKVFIPENTLPHIKTFAQVTFQPGQVAAEHLHEDIYEVMLVEEGTGTIKINGKEYPFTQGTCVTLEPQELHEVINTGRTPLTISFFGLFIK